MEISHKSTANRLRTRVFGSMRPRTVRKPIDSPSMAPAFNKESSSHARATSGISRTRA